MGVIREKPRDIIYPHPKAVGSGKSVGKILGRAMLIERFPKWGDYMRILDLVEWQKDEHHKNPHKEIRFCQFYRKAGGTDKDWIFGQGAGHMKPETFFKLIHKAITKPDYGTFNGILDRFNKR
ncbi:MAG: hypothetical protein COV91_01480 [Candidatus Taylorbacteria bacterium CG11_big_fil_rev_8_21_14_0_20_46_11]|uniref:Uncharacterized protein n=1 Tax=Candidatus Taylorbacteria bacterium CG11_big_fil_rev_8_21_14_0_20_46_11 TaxID=1975025 RepID=A0A2H0KCE4_9BACT|nr:MAG: hypothetical protein COV91_01480 [Candidatus Taylorbacteria bacterium CG11_big_fil_rev_8_21_14_0_20_46_11]